jgi:hypothetical protein
MSRVASRVFSRELKLSAVHRMVSRKTSALWPASFGFCVRVSTSGETTFARAGNFRARGIAKTRVRASLLSIVIVRQGLVQIVDTLIQIAFAFWPNATLKEAHRSAPQHSIRSLKFG